MKSLKNYSNEQILFSNSIQSKLENSAILGVENLILEHGSSIDSIFNKCNIHLYRLKNNNYITESDQNVYFTLEEQYAARDIFVNICEEYKKSLFEEFCIENNIDIDLNQINEGFKDTFTTINNFVKDKSSELKNKFDELKGKVKGISEFLKEIIQKGIKSVKDLIQKFEDLMIKLGQSLKDIIDKLTGGIADKFKDAFMDNVKSAMTEEVKSKELQKQFESLQKQLKNGIPLNEAFVFEWSLFGKKDKEDDSSKGSKNEYEDAIDAKGGKKGRHPLIQILIQIAVHWFVTKGVALIIALAIPGVGPAIATIYMPVASIIWTLSAGVKMIKEIYKKVFATNEFKEYSTKKKIWTVLLWCVSLGLMGYSVWGVGNEIKDIADHFLKGGALENLIPSEQIVNLMNKFNEFWKALGGKSIKNVDDVNKLISQYNTVGSGTTSTSSETITKQAKIGSDGEDLVKDFANKDYKSSMAAWKDLKPNSLSGEQLSSLSPTDKVYVLADGSFNTANAWSREVINTVGDKLNPVNGFNKILNNMNSNAGSIEAFELTYGEYLELVKKGCMGNKNIHAVVGAVKTTAETVTTSITNPLIHIGRSLGFGGLMPIIDSVKGGFKVRLGSGRTGYHLYTIPDKSYIKEVPYSKFISQFSQANASAIKEMQKYIDENRQVAEKNKEALESAKKLSKEEKRRLKAITQYLEGFKEGKSEFKVYVFCTDDELANPSKNDYTANESFDFAAELNRIDEGLFSRKKEDDTDKQDKKSSGKTYPVFFFNPISLAFGDLAPRTKSKKPRSHIYLAKGLFSRLEFIPMNGGMTGKEIIEFFSKCVKESLKASYEMAADAPCYKEGKTWVENDESKEKGKERMDFGGFTNEQITKFMNNPDDVSDFFGGQHATDKLTGGKHQYIEQTDTKEREEHNKKVKKEFNDLLSNNEKLRKYIKSKCPSIWDVLYDKDGNLDEDEFEKLVPSLMRIENTYLKGEDKHGLLKKITKLFKKEKEVDPSEVKKLTLYVASLRKKLKKQKVEEGLEYDDNLLILEANIEVLEEFINE